MMTRLSVPLLVVLSSCLMITAQVLHSTTTKPGCLEKCGNITIPYPFGIGSECSHNASFTVICKQNEDGQLLKPFLSNVDLEVVFVSLDDSTIIVMQAVALLTCSAEPKKMVVGKSFVGTPFTFNTESNILAIVGCNSEVLFEYSHPDSVLGCRPICGYSKLGCHGINCCRLGIPPQLRKLEITYISSTYGNNRSDVCGFAFLADYSWLMDEYPRYTSLQNYSNPLDMSLQYVPMRMNWQSKELSIQSTLEGVVCENRMLNYSTTLDTNNAYSIDDARCYCGSGYEGNPYLPGGGCRDINECSNRTLHNCKIGTTCANTKGSFTCNPDKNQMTSTVVGISSATGALLLLGGAWVSSKVIKKRMKANRRKKLFKRNGGLLLKQQLSSSSGGVNRIRLFGSKELAQATNRYNEDRILGHGGQGTVYKGMLTDGRIVAVKKSDSLDDTDSEVFINEVVILAQINHRNVVDLLGCCLETETPLLVYEYVSNGSLFQCLHDNDEFLLSWKMRVRIATEVSGALSYLHNAASAPIYHRDVKSTNILLDDKYRAKVSDFGTSRLIAIDQTHLTTKVLGTFGYLDPEYFQSSQFTEKSDVYSFGVVLVELLTGEKAISKVRAETGRSLATHFLQSMEEKNLLDIVDPKIIKEGPLEEIEAVAELARRCLNLNGKRRPTMKEVVAGLVGIQMPKEGPGLSVDLEDMEFQAIEISEDYEFLTTSNNTDSNDVTAESSESCLLY